MIGLIIFIIFAVIAFIWYEVAVYTAIDRRYNGPDPDCVTCNGYPVSMVPWRLGWDDIFFDEPLCIKHQLQGRRIVYLEAVTLDNPLEI